MTTPTSQRKSRNGKSKTADAEDQDEGKNATFTIAQAKPPGHAFWPPTRQLVWLSIGLYLPEDIQNWPQLPLESIATPASVDIALLTIPLTANELLTFFPRHTNNYHLQDRLTRNGIKGADQAAMIN